MKKAEGLGERKIIEMIQKHLDLMPNMSVPFGDDVSACEIGRENLAVLKSDMLVGATDVPLGMSLWQAARKAAVMNVSDFAAKGVEPVAMLVSLGLPRRTTEKDIKEIAEGLNAGAREYEAYIIGGDTGESSDLIISVALFGMTTKTSLMLRSGARPGDVLAVTGQFGKTSCGLRILVGNLGVGEKLRRVLVESVLMPKARLKEGLALSRTGAVTASIDSSDGLAWSLHEIARASRVGFKLTSLPIAEEVQKFAELNKSDASALALYGGEEYELVLTVRPHLWGRAHKAVAKAGGRLIRVGEATDREEVVLKKNGRQMRVEPRGYEHFKS